MRSFTRRENKMWLLTLFPGSMKMKGPSFLSHSLYQIGSKLVHQEWLQDPKISCLIQQLQDNSPVSPGYSWHNDELHYKGCLYLRKQSQLKSTVLSELHASPTTGHSGFTKTYERVKHSFFNKTVPPNSASFSVPNP
jgi:hypothetical protein